MFSQSSFRFSLIAVVTLSTVGCAQAKITQCDNIIALAHAVGEETLDLTDGGQTQDPQAILQAADFFDQAAQEMSNLDIQDVQLQDYQSRFIKMYRGISQSTRGFVSAFNEKDRETAELALQSMQKATEPERDLVNEINTYCTRE